AAVCGAMARIMIAPDTNVLDEHVQAGSILVIASSPADPDVARTVDVLRSLAETTLTGADAAMDLLARVDADLIIADESLGAQSGCDFLAEAIALRPSAVPLLLARSGPRPVARNGNGLAVLRKPVDEHALRTIASLALRTAILQRAVRELEDENLRLRPFDQL